MIYTIIIVILNLAALGFSVHLLLKKEKAFVSGAKNLFKDIEIDISDKKEVLNEVYQLARKTISTADLDKLKSDVKKIESAVGKSREAFEKVEGEHAKKEAELKELRELEAELETSESQAKEHLLVLEEENKRMQVENEELLDRLQETLSTLDKLMVELEEIKGAAEQLNEAKTQMLESQGKIEFYETDIQQISQNTIDLKSAYDALDIEYAQLYEKQVL